MPIAFNNKTQLPTFVPPEVLADPASAGLYSSIEDKTIPLKSPDGKVYQVKGDQLEKSVREGWTIPTVAEEEHHKNLEDFSKGGGAAGAFVDSAANELLLGAPKIIEHKLAPEAEDFSKEVAEEHPIASGLGSVAGIGGSLLYGGGEIGKGAEALVLGKDAAQAGVAKKIFSKAVQGVVDGGLYSAPQAIAHTIVGDPEKAAESMMWGMGVGGVAGGVIGAGGQAVSKLGEALGSKAEESLPGLKKLSNEVLLKKHGISASDLNNIGPIKGENILNVLDGEGKLTETTSTPYYQELRKDAGKEIGKYREKVDAQIANPDKVDTLEDTLVDSKPPVDPRNLAPDMGKVGIEARQKILALNPEIESSPFLAKEKEHLDKLSAMFDESAGNGEIFTDDGRQLHTMDAFTKEKAALGNLTKWKYGESDSINRMNQVFYSGIRDEEHRAMTEILGKSPGGGEDYLGYIKQKKRYEAARDLIKKGNPTNSTADYGKIPGQSATGGLSGMAAMIELMQGHPVVAAGIMAKKLAGSWIKETGLPKAAAYIRRISNDPQTAGMIGPALANDGLEGLKQSIAKIPQLISGASDKGINTVSRIATSTSFKDFLGDKANGLSKDQQYNKITSDIAKTANDPKLFAQNIQHILGTFGDHPELAHMIAQKHAVALNYLNAHIPRNPGGLQPFSKNDWKPSASQKQEYADRLAVVNNPMIVFDAVKTGTISNAMVDTLKTVYPSIYGSFVQAIGTHAYTKEAENTPYATKLALSKLVGIPLDKSLSILPDIQAMYAQNGSPPRQGKSGGRSKKASLDKVPQTQTQIQRLDAKQNK